MGALRVLLSEGSSLTAREVLTCLGPAGHDLEVLDPDPLCLARFSRWVRKVHVCPPPTTEPRSYLELAKRTVAERSIDVVLPTHEQAWLFAAAGAAASDLPFAVADVTAFDRVQSKIAFARLLDDLTLPQPDWRLVRDEGDLAGFPLPYWLKAAFSTAGRGVRPVRDERARASALGDLQRRSSGVLMAQQPAQGRYGQVQGLFEHGRLVAVHTSVQVGTGLGGSAAARLSVDHPAPRRHIATIGEALAWHGGLTLDYMHLDGVPQYIECNPRTVEPANAAASGVNIPELQLRLTLGEDLPSVPCVGTPGVRTHGTLALVLGAAGSGGTRRAVVAELGRALMRRGCYRQSREQLTPALRDPPSAAALAYTVLTALVRPAWAARLASGAIARYSVTDETIALVTESGAQVPPAA
jgi:hypothetical protein